MAHISLQSLMAFGLGSPHILHHQLDTMCMDFFEGFQVGLQPVRDRGGIYYTWKSRAPPLLEVYYKSLNREMEWRGDSNSQFPFFTIEMIP